MARCPSCNRFVGVEIQEPEVQELDFNDGEINLSVRLVKCCSECGEELAEAIAEASHTIEKHEDHHDEIEVEEHGVTESTRYEGKGQYTKTFYGADVEVYVHCNKCKVDDVITMHVEEQLY